MVFINNCCFSQELPLKKVTDPSGTPINSANESSKPPLPKTTSIPSTKEVDSVKIDTLKQPETLADAVKYKAKDYVKINRKSQKILLYNNAQVNYEDLQINAGRIIIDYNKSEVYAYGITDTTDAYTQAPVFKQGKEEVKPDSIRFNFDTRKALIFGSRTEQGEIKVNSQIVKRENDSTYFMKEMLLTTSENLDDPEYYFRVRKAKFVPKKKIVAGLTNMYIYGVPTPLGLPFAYFPLTQERSSGFIIPTFGENNNRGYFLQNGGYYFAISDYIDLAVLGDYYTNGSYGLRGETNYAKRYRFRGNLSVRYENLINSERGFPDFSKSSVYNIRWSHAQDAKANPNSRFSASVNLGSSSYYQQSVNQLNTPSFLNNTLSSSVSYAKTFQGEPQVNMSVTATHSQNTNTEQINMTLPTFQGSVGRIFPFAPKSGTKKGFFHNINLQYNARAENRIATTDSLFFKKEMFDDALVGMQHSIPLSTNFKLFKYLSVSASADYNEVWTLNTIDRFYDETGNDGAGEVVTKQLKGFDSFRTYGFSTSMGTTIYGKFNFVKEGKEPNIEAIRHVMRPNISYNIQPSFEKYYDTYAITADGLTQEEVDFSRFENSIFGAPGRIMTSAVGLSLNNTFEAKVRSKDTTNTDAEARKIMLLNNLNFNTSYNIAGDSLRFSPVRMSGGTQIFKNKLNINFNANLDPYALDNNNVRIDKFNIDNGGSLFRLTSANITANYAFSSKDFNKKTTGNPNSDFDNTGLRNGGRADDLFGESNDFTVNNTSEDEEQKDKKEVTLYNYALPWNLRLAYAVTYNNAARQNEISSQSLMFSGNVELSPRWTVGVSSGYDFKNNGFTYTQLRFERDLLSWKLNFNWVPFSSRESWYFFIGIKSGMLSDIKWDKRREPDRNL
jgi:lipopolysaccharide assembly outer membrane protein LptD (OstA)